MKIQRLAAKPLRALRCARNDFSNRLRAHADSPERRMSKAAQCAEQEAGLSVVPVGTIAFHDRMRGEFLTKNYLHLTLRLSVCSFILLRPKRAVGVARIRLQSLGARLLVIQRQTLTASDRESRQHGVWGRVFRAFDAPSVKHRQSEILSGTLRGL